MEFIAYQVKAALSGLTPEQVKKVVIAYEPIWAIGTGKTATDELINAKIKALLEKDITPILCVGESLDQRERDLTMAHITYQVKADLFGLTPAQVKKVVIAYEPIWAIGTGRTATAEQAEEVCFAIRELLRRDYGALISRKVSILYGGSMNAANCAELLAQPNIDGGLIGGASLKVPDFARIVLAGCEE